MPDVHKQYFVCPFPSYDSVVGASVRKYGLKENCTSVTPFHRALEDVEREATLLIAGHGVEGGEEISNGKAPPERLSLTVAGLAQLISKVWKLPRTHVKIRMLGCECNGFARKLAEALEAYDDVAVGGYVDSVNGDAFDDTTGRGSMLSQVDFGEPMGIRLFTKEQMASAGIERIQWFNNKGVKIDKPDFPKLIALRD